MIAYEYVPSKDPQSLFRIEIDTESRQLAVRYNAQLEDYIRQIKESDNLSAQLRANRVLMELRYFWRNRFCRDEKMVCHRSWTVAEATDYLKNHCSDLYHILVD